MDQVAPLLDRRILVTGGSGYVGSVLVPFLARYWSVRVLETMAFGNPIEGTTNVEFIKGDILDAPVRQAALKGCTDVVHLAGIVTDDLVDMNPEYARRVNITATTALCHEAQALGVKRFIYASSSSVYGAHAEDCTEESETRPMTAYAQGKLDAERIVINRNAPGFSTVAIRSATCCGPAPRMRLDTIVNVFSKQAYYDGVISVHGGAQWRSNIHVQDIARIYGLLLSCESGLIAGQVFNATCENHQARTIAEMVRRIMGGRIVIEDRPDNRDYRLSAARLQRVFGWHPLHSINQAITDNLLWFAGQKNFNPNSDLYFNTRRMKDVLKGVVS